MKSLLNYLSEIPTLELGSLIVFILLAGTIIALSLVAVRLAKRFKQVMLGMPVVQGNTVKWDLSAAKMTELQNILNVIPRMIFGNVTFDFIEIGFIYSVFVIFAISINYLINIIS